MSQDLPDKAHEEVTSSSSGSSTQYHKFPDSNISANCSSNEGLPNNFTMPNLEEGVSTINLDGKEEEAVGVQMQQKESPKDILDTEAIKVLTKRYEEEIRCLREKLACSSGSDAVWQIAEENKKLNMRNTVLACTNASLVQKCADLQKRLNDAEKAVGDLRKRISPHKFSGSTAKQFHPGGDAGLSSLLDSPHNSKGEIEKQSSDESSVDQLKAYLKEYYKLLLDSQCKNRRLEEDAMQCQRTIMEQENNFKKLTKQLETVVQERDKLEAELNNPSRAYLQPGGNAELAEGNTETSSDILSPAVLTDHYKNLTSEMKEKIRAQQLDLAYKDSHILEQEAKIQKLVAQCNKAMKERDDYNKQVSNAGASEVKRLENELKDKNLQLVEMSKSIDSLKQQVTQLKQENEELKSQTHSEDNYAVQEQLKAFQDDYFAEREEKRQLIEKSRMLQEKNQSLILQLQNRPQVQRNQFSSPPPGPNPSPPVAHRQPEFSQYTPPGQGHQPGEFHIRQPLQSVPHSTVPGGYQEFPAFQRSNTIPPRRGNNHQPNYDTSYSFPYGSDPPYYLPQMQHVPSYEQTPHYPLGYPEPSPTMRPRMHDHAQHDPGTPPQGTRQK